LSWWRDLGDVDVDVDVGGGEGESTSIPRGMAVFIQRPVSLTVSVVDALSGILIK
jgi:hypothetical protein